MDYHTSHSTVRRTSRDDARLLRQRLAAAAYASGAQATISENDVENRMVCDDENPFSPLSSRRRSVRFDDAGPSYSDIVDGSGPSTRFAPSAVAMRRGPNYGMRYDPPPLVPLKQVIRYVDASCQTPSELVTRCICADIPSSSDDDGAIAALAESTGKSLIIDSVGTSPNCVRFCAQCGEAVRHVGSSASLAAVSLPMDAQATVVTSGVPYGPSEGEVAVFDYLAEWSEDDGKSDGSSSSDPSEATLAEVDGVTCYESIDGVPLNQWERRYVEQVASV